MKSSEVLKYLNVTRVTLSRYVKLGKIKVVKLDNGYYDYDQSDVLKIKGVSERKNVIYSRVSTKKQKPDLDNQVKFLKSFCSQEHVKVDHVFADISSGMNLDRRHLKELLDLVFDYKVDRVYISSKDRLTRTGFDLLKDIFGKFMTEIVVCQEEDQTEEKDLLSEIVSIIHTFSMKMYSSRKKKRLDLIKQTIELDVE